MGIGRERRAETTGLKEVTKWWSRSTAPEEEPADWAHARSKPLEKNLPWAVVMSAEPLTAWDLTWERAKMRVSMRVRLKRWSSSPVRVRKKRLPRFSNVHILVGGYCLQSLSFSLSLSYYCVNAIS